MTLHTRVHLTGEITPEAAFDLALRAILTAAGEEHRLEHALIKRNPSLSASEDTYIGTVIGQGLPAITDARARRDGSLTQPDGPDPDFPDEQPWGDRSPWTVAISWDTAYGYSGPTWPNAASLHGGALIALHGGLPEGVTVRWENEFTSEWNDGLAGLEEFMGEGRRAHAFGMLATALVVAEITSDKAGAVE